ncbi:MAG: prohibitin family protein [Bacteroidetes bacterium]|nr:prohibitin family protein [Bacteroidota bacterium]
MKNYSTLVYLLLSTFLFASCVVVKPGEVAVKQRIGKLVGEPVNSGAKIYNPFISYYIKVPTRIVNKKIDLDIPSREGLTIQAEMSILYRINPDSAKKLITQVGTSFEEEIIAPVFRSALADVSAKFMAKDMHTGQRAEIEKEVQKMMMQTLEPLGIIIERVLMKRIILPTSLSRAIEEKLAAEQEAQRMEFVLQREKQEIERKQIEAKGIADARVIDAKGTAESQIIEAEGTAKAQEILAAGLSEEILRFKMIEAYLKLSQSTNAKIIISNGEMPVMLQD